MMPIMLLFQSSLSCYVILMSPLSCGCEMCTIISSLGLLASGSEKNDSLYFLAIDSFNSLTSKFLLIYVLPLPTSVFQNNPWHYVLKSAPSPRTQQN